MMARTQGTPVDLLFVGTEEVDELFLELWRKKGPGGKHNLDAVDHRFALNNKQQSASRLAI